MQRSGIRGNVDFDDPGFHCVSSGLLAVCMITRLEPCSFTVLLLYLIKEIPSVRLINTLLIRKISFILLMALPLSCIADEVYFVLANPAGKQFEEKCERLEYRNINDALSYLKNNANNFRLILPLQQTKQRELYFIGQQTDAEGELSQGFITDSKRICLFLWEASQYKKQAGPGLYRFAGGVIGGEQACVEESDIHSIPDAFTVMVSHYGWQNVRIPEINLPSIVEVRIDGEWQKFYFSDKRSCEKMRTVFTNATDSYRDRKISASNSDNDAASNALKTPPEKQWWSADSSFTECIENSGPAAKLDQFVGFTDKPYTRDFRDSNENIVKVEVINSVGGGLEKVWTYYKEKDQCEAEQVNATKSLADKYR